MVQINFLTIILFFIFPQLFIRIFSDKITNSLLLTVMNYTTLGIMTISTAGLIVWNLRLTSSASKINKSFSGFFIFLSVACLVFSLVILYLLLALRNGVSL